MHHKSTVKKIFKLIFFFIQSLLFISGIAILIVSTTIYTKSHELLQMPMKILVLSFILGVLEILSSISGYVSLSSKRRLRMFVYVTTTLILMNVQVLMAVKSSIIHEKSHVWADMRWNVLYDDQKNLIQEKFKCCGFLNPTDRSGSVCNGGEGCIQVIHGLSKTISSSMQRILMFSFFFESIGIGILSMLRLRK